MYIIFFLVNRVTRDKERIMRYGNFDDEKREYCITSPGTPYPWINYLGTQDFFSIISNTAGGYSFYKDARLRRITRFRYNNVPIDDGGKYFYINDGVNISSFSTNWLKDKNQSEFFVPGKNFKTNELVNRVVKAGDRYSVIISNDKSTIKMWGEFVGITDFTILPTYTLSN